LVVECCRLQDLRGFIGFLAGYSFTDLGIPLVALVGIAVQESIYSITNRRRSQLG
jgi:hypothetical protein